VKLADFGIAKAAEQSDITKIGSVLGTAAYLSPEQARGEPAGPQSDLYALGVVAYQLLAGRLPYEAASLTDLARQQDTAAPVPLHELDPAIPSSVSAVVARALAREPERRFADAAAMDRALGEALGGVAPPAPPPPATDDTEATRKLDQTALTTPLARTARTSAAPPRRRMEPIAEPAPPPRRPAPAAAEPQRQPARRRRPGGAARALRALLIAALLAVLAVGAFVLLTSGSERRVQLREDIQGNVEQSVQQLEDLIRENTR
jgi:serine/threonine-protein kinase